MMDGFGDSSKRGSGGAKRIDLTELRAAMKDERAWASLGLVWLPPGETSHYDLEPDQSGTGTDVLVHVQQMPNGEPLLCRLACAGVWRIPPVGWEVDLIIPDGELEGGAYIVGAHSPGTVPAALDGDTLAAEAPQVNVKATAGDAVFEASGVVHIAQTGATEQGVALGGDLKTFLDGLKTWMNSHTHPTAGTGAPSAPTAAFSGAPPAASASVKVTP